MSQPEPIRFFVPGPSYVLDDVRQAMAAPVMGHRSAAFRALYGRVAERLQTVFRTAGADMDAMVATGSATLVMESALVSTVPPDAAVLNLTCGAFSERWHTITKALGLECRAGVGAVGRGDRPRPGAPGARRPALRCGHRGPQRDLDRRDQPAGRDRPGDPGGERRPGPRRRRLVAGRSAGRERRPGGSTSCSPARRRRSRCLPDWRSSPSPSAPPRCAEGVAAPRLLHRPPPLPRQAPRGEHHHHAGGVALLRSRPPARAHRRRGDAGALGAPPGAPRPHPGLGGGAGLRGRGGGGRPVADRQLPPAAARARRRPTWSGAWPSAGFTVGGGYGDWKASTFRIGHMGEVRSEDLDALLAAIDDWVATASAAPAVEARA